MRSKIKICGITRAEDALLAEELGADFIGLIFTRTSPRCVTVEQARQITARLTRARAIGVFVEQNFDETTAIAAATGLSGIQHYTLFPAKPAPCFYVHAHAVQGKTEESLLNHSAPDYLLLDTYSKNQHGGTGKIFDWSILPTLHRHRIFLAGGIGPHNIRQALSHYPYAIDLSSGVEDRPGIKSAEKLKHLFAEIDHARAL